MSLVSRADAHTGGGVGLKMGELMEVRRLKQENVGFFISLKESTTTTKKSLGYSFMFKAVIKLDDQLNFC